MFFCCRRKIQPTIHFGFLPKTFPRSTLIDTEPKSLNAHINRIAHELPMLLKEGKLLDEITTLDVKFSQNLIKIADAEDKATAILMLTMISQAYIFNDPKNPQKSLPSVLSKNLIKLCEDRNIHIITYDDYILHNFTLLDKKKGFSLENIEPLFTFTDSSHEKGFIKIHVAIEAACSKALDLIREIAVLKQLKNDDPSQAQRIDKQTLVCLQEIAQALKASGTLLQTMYSQCDSNFFTNNLRPYVTGWGVVSNLSADGKIQSGVKLTLEEDSEKLYAYQGPSGAQSSILPAFDAFLDVHHEPGTPVHNFQAYMPQKDRAFIQDAAKAGIKNLHNNHEGSSLVTEDADVKKAYETAIGRLAAFRKLHKNIVHHYLGIEKHVAHSDVKGTGGTNPITFLGALIEDTLKKISQVSDSHQHLQQMRG